MSSKSTTDSSTDLSQQQSLTSTASCSTQSIADDSLSYYSEDVSSSEVVSTVPGSLTCYSDFSSARENEIYVTFNNVKDPEANEESKTKPKKSAASSQCTSAKKKKKKRKATICITNCKYDIIRDIAHELGMREVGDRDLWNIMWSDCTISVEKAKEMKRFQKANHFPGISELCRKDLLARNLNRMLKVFPKEYNFYPKTWCLPADLGEAIAYSRSHRNKVFILKPEVGCRGRGIFLTRNLKDVKPFERLICQLYISKPFLVDGFKFDMRIYTLISSVDPLRIYVYNDGLARFATSRYCEPAPHNVTNMYMHLTNYSVNKHSRTFVVDEEAGSKRRISTINNWLEKKQYNVAQLWANIDDIIIKTVIAGHPNLKHSYNACFPCHDFTFACFELLGFDIILDYKLKPHLLEVNHSPSYHADTQLDREVKESLLKDTFTILNLMRCDKKKVMEEDRQRVQERLLQAISNKNTLPDINLTSKSPNGLANQIKWEESHMGNYRLIYPTTDETKYQVYFTQTQSSLFQETFASRAREEAGRLHREEFEMKLRDEASLRIGSKNRLLHPESPQGKPKIKKMPPLKKKAPSNSFEPEPIVEAEEKERVSLMAQRDFLVRSFRVVDQVNMVLKKFNNEKPTNNETKQDIIPAQPIIPPRKLDSITNILSSDILSKYSQKPLKDSLNNGQSVKGTIIEPPKVMKDSKTETYCIDRWHTPKSLSAKIHPGFPNKLAINPTIPGLEVMCNEVSIRVRPDLPASAQWPTVGAKSTKTHIARHFSNTVKIHGLERRLSSEKYISFQ